VSRYDGFVSADIDVAMLDDVKFRRLWRILGHQGLMAEATTIYVAVVLRSWHDGNVATAEDAVPTWVNPTPDVLAALVAAGLLDADHRLEKRSFDSWFRPAWERRERMRAGGRAGVARREANRTTDRTAPTDTDRTVNPSSTLIAPLKPPLDDPTDTKLIEDLRRFATSPDELVAKSAVQRLERMGLTA
jgi:hypothetical protein